MAKLPQGLDLSMTQNKWASQIEPVLNNPIVNSVLLKNISLATGTNVINHRLGRPLTGWYTTRVRANATIYDNQDANKTPELTLILIASAPVIIDLEVF